MPTLAAARMQCWAVILQANNYQVEYRPSKEQGNADALSHLPCNNPPLKEEAGIFFFSSIEELPTHAKDRDKTRFCTCKSVKLYSNWMAKLCKQ